MRGADETTTWESLGPHGYDATGVAHNCQSADGTKGALCHHFPSEQAFFLGLDDHWPTQLDAQLTAANAGEGTIPQRLLQMVRMKCQVFQHAGRQLAMFLEFSDRACSIQWGATGAGSSGGRAVAPGRAEAEALR